MAIPTTHNAITSDTTFGLSHQIDLPPDALESSLCLLFLSNGTAEAPSNLAAVLTGNGWTELHNSTGGNWRGIYARVMSAADATEAAGGWSITLTNATNSKYAAIAFEIRGQYGSTVAAAVELVVQQRAAAESQPYNFTALNPTGWGVEDTLWIAGYQADGTNTLTVTPVCTGVSPSVAYTEIGTVAGTSSSGRSSVWKWSYSVGNGVASETPGGITGSNARSSALSTIGIRPGTGVIKKLRLLAHSSAAGASGVAGVVFQAPTGGALTGAKIGEFTGMTFEAALYSGQAELKVPVAYFGGEALTTSDVPVALARNTTNTTGIISCTVFEE